MNTALGSSSVRQPIHNASFCPRGSRLPNEQVGQGYCTKAGGGLTEKLSTSGRMVQIVIEHIHSHVNANKEIHYC